MASFTFAPSHPFAVGTTVSVYEDKGQNPSGSPAGPAVATATVAAGGGLTVTGLTSGKYYWVVGLVSGAYRWVRISTPPEVASLLLPPDLVHVAQHGITPDSTASFNDGAIVEALAEAEERRTADGSIQGTGLLFGQGCYDFSAEIVAGGCSLIGAHKFATMLRWAAAIGSGKYAIKGSQGFEPMTIENMHIRGITADPGIGLSPQLADGIRLPSGAFLRHCKVEGFRRGVQGFGDHWSIDWCDIENNQDGICWDLSTVTAKADQSLTNSRLDGNYRSSISVPRGGRMASATVINNHFGFCPVGIYGFDDGSGATEPVISIGSKFIDCSWESIGNALIYAEGQLGRVIENTFEGCETTGDLDSNFYWSSIQRAYAHYYSEFANNVVTEGSGLFTTFRGVTGSFSVPTMSGNVVYSRKTLAQAAYQVGRKMFDAATGPPQGSNSWMVFLDDVAGRATYYKATASIAVGDVLGSDDAYPPTCRPWQSGDIYLGVALSTTSSGDWVLVQKEGVCSGVKTTAGQFDSAKGYATPDLVNAGAAKVGTAFPVIGWGHINSGATLVTLNLGGDVMWP